MSELQWKPRLKIFKGCNGKCTFNPETFIGLSYGWWQVVRKIKGKVVFNDYSYSSTTSRHQGALWAHLNYKADLSVEVPKGLQNFESDALPYLYKKIFDVQERLSNPKIREKTVKELLHTVEYYEKQIKLCRELGAKISKEKISELKEASIIESMEAALFRFEKADEAKQRVLDIQDYRKKFMNRVKNKKVLKRVRECLNEEYEVGYWSVHRAFAEVYVGKIPWHQDAYEKVAEEFISQVNNLLKTGIGVEYIQNIRE